MFMLEMVETDMGRNEQKSEFLMIFGLNVIKIVSQVDSGWSKR